jgi:hypothetical protein
MPVHVNADNTIQEVFGKHVVHTNPHTASIQCPTAVNEWSARWSAQFLGTIVWKDTNKKIPVSLS